VVSLPPCHRGGRASLELCLGAPLTAPSQLFFLFLEGKAAAPATVAALDALPGIRTFLQTEALLASHNNSRIWHEKWLAAFFNKPCNYELFVRQNLNLETAIAAALADGSIGWIAHIGAAPLGPCRRNRLTSAPARRHGRAVAPGGRGGLFLEKRASWGPC